MKHILKTVLPMMLGVLMAAFAYGQSNETASGNETAETEMEFDLSELFVQGEVDSVSFEISDVLTEIIEESSQEASQEASQDAAEQEQ